MQCYAMSESLHEQLHRAWERSEMSLETLRSRAALECSADSLSRKLRGKQVLSTSEAEALAVALDKKVSYDGRRKVA